MIYRYQRIRRLIEQSIRNENLNLKNMFVLTEAASGSYVVTPIIAAMAGAEKVYVTGRDSRYGQIKDILSIIKDMQLEFGIPENRIVYVADKNEVACEINITTNSGFVRPIDREYLSKLPKDSAIPLMFESWEYRDGDIDIQACRDFDIPVLGTNENVNHLNIFRYVGMIALKMLLEKEIEVFGSRILLLSSRGFLESIKYVLESNSAIVQAIDIEASAKDIELTETLAIYDSIILADQTFSKTLIGDEHAFIHVNSVDQEIPILYISGLIDYDRINSFGLDLYPNKRVESHSMAIATDYVGVRPVIELNTAGLKVGQAMVEGKRKYKTAEKVEEYALQNSNSLPL